MSVKRWQVRLRRWVAVAVGLGVGAVTAPFLGIAAALVSGWAALAVVIVVWTTVEIWPMNAEQTQDHATSEDPGRGLAWIIALLGSLVSLGAVIMVMVQARSASGAEALALAGIAIVSVVSSWALIQTDYLLRYARIYYQADSDTGRPVRGISFHQSEDPEYTDFVYFSVGLGMTYQVADTDLNRNEMRRIAIAQTMLAYLFGAGILAAVLNLVTSLAG